MNWCAPIDFLGTFPHYVDHLAPIYLAMEEDMRGEFYVPEWLVGHAAQRGVTAHGLRTPANRRNSVHLPRSNSPIVTCGYRDLQSAYRSGKRPLIFMQHGVGMMFPNNPAYAGGVGYQRYVSLFLHPNEMVERQVQAVFPNKAGEVVGVPKMDSTQSPLPVPPVSKSRNRGKAKPVVCISFHWDGAAIAPEAGNAFGHYKGILPSLAERDDFILIGHGHPRFMEVLEPFYRRHGIEVVHDFNEVMQRANVYINDCSSTLFEFCTTGKPVIVLNAPQFRKHAHYGIRFWDYADVGPQVERAEELPGVIEQVLGGKDAFKAARQKAVKALYPFLGQSAERAAEVIENFVESKGPTLRRVEQMDGESIGIVYMSFGKNAARAIRQSVNSLHRLGIDIPVCAIGDTPVRGCQFVEWTGESPFDPEQRRNFQFRAGRVKPFFDRSHAVRADDVYRRGHGVHERHHEGVRDAERERHRYRARAAENRGAV